MGWMLAWVGPIGLTHFDKRLTNFVVAELSH
jgi:hypothetical protein